MSTTTCVLCSNQVFIACPSCMNLLCFDHVNTTCMQHLINSDPQQDETTVVGSR